jgi:hypothetical protein
MKLHQRLLLFLASCVSPFILAAQETAILQWANHVGGTKGDLFRDIAKDPSGNIITIGDFNETADFDPSAATYNIVAPNGGGYTMKMDADGNLIWAKSFQGELGIGTVSMYSLIVDDAGSSYITGEFYGTVDFDPGPAVFNLVSAGYDDIFFAKLDASGNFVWAKALPSVGAYVHSKQIGVDADHNVYLTGTIRNTTDFDPGPGETLLVPVATHMDTFFAKYDANGNLLWLKSIWYPVPSTTQSGAGADALTIDENGNMLIGGAFQGTSDFNPGAGTFNLTSNGARDAYILKLDKDGNFIWATSYGGTFAENITCLKTDGTHIYVVGDFEAQPTDFDPGPGQTILTGKLYTSKFDANGNFVWARTMGGMYIMQSWLAIDAGNVYITSSFHSIFGPADFDPGASEYLLTAEVWDLALTKLTKDGNFVWAVSGGAPDDFENNGKPVLDAAGNIYVGGSFGRTADFDPSACVYNITSYGQIDAFTYKVSQQTSIAAPTITSFTPGSGPVGSTVVITGTNFSATPSSNTVKFANNRTATVTSSTTTSLTVTVPASAITGKITVTVNCQTATSATDFIVGVAALPTITSFNPTSGATGATVTITGTNFSATPGNNIVRFNGTIATATTSTTTSITTSVPAGATTGKITVTVAGNTATSATDFTLTTASGIVINPQPQSINTCEGLTESFSINASGAANITYQWQKFNGASFANISNGGGYSGVTTKDLSINTTGNFGAGEYRCRVSGNATPDVYTQTATLTVNAYPIAEISINGSTLVASSGDSYQWYQNGTLVPQGTNQTFLLNVAEFGSYAVDVTVDGCTSTSDEFIYLMTANETIHDGLKIYPNPFKDHITIETTSQETLKVMIIDILGRPVSNHSIKNTTTLNVGDLSQGNYILIIQKGALSYRYRLQRTD